MARAAQTVFLRGPAQTDRQAQRAGRRAAGRVWALNAGTLGFLNGEPCAVRAFGVVHCTCKRHKPKKKIQSERSRRTAARVLRIAQMRRRRSLVSALPSAASSCATPHAAFPRPPREKNPPPACWCLGGCVPARFSGVWCGVGEITSRPLYRQSPFRLCASRNRAHTQNPLSCLAPHPMRCGRARGSECAVLCASVKRRLVHPLASPWPPASRRRRVPIRAWRDDRACVLGFSGCGWVGFSGG